MAAVRNGRMGAESQSWLGAVDVGYLTEAERDAILDVLNRDDRIRKTEQERITKLKSDLRDVRRKGAKRTDNSYSTRVCARCNNKTGLIINASTQCPVCNHKVCKNCLMSGVFSRTPKCIVCYQETKLKAETGEWFYGIMRPELRQMQDGSTVVKHAVLTKPVHFDQRSSASTRSTPAIMCTPASSNSVTSSKKDAASVTSYGTEDTGSSTESHKQRVRKERSGPAETGSIESLRKEYQAKRTYSGDSVDGSEVIAPPRRFHTLPTAGRSHEVPEPVIDDRTSDSSIDSKSIDGVVEEYRQKQMEEESLAQRQAKASDQRTKYGRSLSHDNSLKGDEETRRYRGEADDQITQLPPQKVPTLPRRLNEKLLRQNRLTVSVPTVYDPVNKKGKPGTMAHDEGSEHGSMDLPLTANRELSSSVPNLSQSNTSLNSVGLHDLTISGEIKFSLSFNYKTDILLVNVAECRNIATADRRRRRSDPYVKCYLLPDRKNKQKTDVKKRTVNPVYNKCLKFSASHSELSTRVLELSVWHAGTFTRNIFLGQVQVPLDTWNWDSQNQNWFPLRQRETINADFVRGTMYKGDLIIGLKYTPSASASPGKHKAPFGEINILIKQAKNLTPVRSNGTVDAYVKIMMQPDKQFRQKTSVIPKASSPEWNYNIRMQLYQPMEECGLQLTIWHRDKLQGSTFLGGSRLNLGREAGEHKWMDAFGVEKSLWQSAINLPCEWVDETIQLRAKM